MSIQLTTTTTLGLQAFDPACLDALADLGLPRDPALISHLDLIGSEDDGYEWDLVLTDPHLDLLVAIYTGTGMHADHARTEPGAYHLQHQVEALLETLIARRAGEITPSPAQPLTDAEPVAYTQTPYRPTVVARVLQAEFDCSAYRAGQAAEAVLRALSTP